MPGDIIKSVPPLEGGEPITVIVPEGHVWLEGDNPLYSKGAQSIRIYSLTLVLIRFSLLWTVANVPFIW